MLRVFFKDCFSLFSSPKKQGWLAEAEVLADLGLQLFLHPDFEFIAGNRRGTGSSSGLLSAVPFRTPKRFS